MLTIGGVVEYAERKKIFKIYLWLVCSVSQRGRNERSVAHLVRFRSFRRFSLREYSSSASSIALSSRSESLLLQTVVLKGVSIIYKCYLYNKKKGIGLATKKWKLYVFPCKEYRSYNHSDWPGLSHV